MILKNKHSGCPSCENNNPDAWCGECTGTVRGINYKKKTDDKLFGEIPKPERLKILTALSQVMRRDERLKTLEEVRAMVEKRLVRNRSRAKAMKAQFPPGKELYCETEQTYLSFLREDSEIASRLDKLINAVLQPNISREP